MTNIDVTPGTGKSVATETITATEYQMVKLIDATAASTARTGVAANPLQVSLANTGANATAIKVDNSAVTQPVSGSLTAVSTVTNLSQLGGAAIAMGTGVRSAGTQRVTIATDDSVPVTGTFYQATQPVSAASLPLPTGASTSALQTTGNSSLSSIDGKVPALGQALAAASVPVVLPAATITTLTPPTTVTANQGTANATPWNENLKQINGTTASTGNGATDAGTLRVSISNDSTGLISINGYPDGTGSGSLTASGQTASIVLNGYYGGSFVLTGTWVGTIVAELSGDGGTTWAQTSIYNVATQAITTNVKANGTYQFLEIGGMSHLRVRCSAYTSGTIAVALRVTNGQSLVDIGNKSNPPAHASTNGTPVTATATSAVAAPSAGNHLRIVRIHMSNGGSTACWVAVRDGAAGTRYYNTYLVQGAVFSLDLNTSGALDLTSATRLDIFLSAAGSVEYQVDYFTVAD